MILHLGEISGALKSSTKVFYTEEGFLRLGRAGKDGFILKGDFFV